MNEPMDTEQLKQHVSNKHSWFRLLWVLACVMLFIVASSLALALSIIATVLLLLTGEGNKSLSSFGGQLGEYLKQLVAYGTLSRRSMPFPIADWPAGDSNDAEDDTASASSAASAADAPAEVVVTDPPPPPASDAGEGTGSKTTAPKSAAKKPAAKKPAAKKKPAGSRSAAKKPAAKKTPVKKPAAKKPAARKTVASKSSGNTADASSADDS